MLVVGFRFEARLPLPFQVVEVVPGVEPHGDRELGQLLVRLLRVDRLLRLRVDRLIRLLIFLLMV
jgi:hypothetical protein